MIISLANQKGGVGKTTTSINLGVFLADAGKKVLVLDLDPQSNLTSGLGLTKELAIDKNIYNLLSGKNEANEVYLSTKYKNLFIIPASIELAGAEVELVNAMSRETLLKSALESIRDEFDYVLIDCPPSLGLLTINALVASDYVFIPVQAEYFALEGLGQLINTINLVKKRLNNKLSVGGVILTMYDSRTNLARQVNDEVRKFFGDKVFTTIIPRNVRLSEAPSHGKAIFDYDPKSQGGFAYHDLAQEVLKKYG